MRYSPIATVRLKILRGFGTDELVIDADPAEQPTAAADMTALPDETEWVEEDHNDPNGFHFTGQPGLKTQPEGDSPLDYFDLFFTDREFDEVAEETNW